MKRLFLSKGIVIALSVIVISLLGLVLYNSYATSSGITLGNDENTYDILLNESSNTVEVPSRSSKTVYYQFSNTNKGTIKYHIGYTSDNVTAKVWWDTEDSIFGTIEYGEYKFIKLKLINESNTDDTITIKPVLGFVNGGDVIPDSNTTLVTGTINQTNTMNIMPADALVTLGIDKANVKELSFVKDNIPSIDSIGSTNLNDDGSIKLWYTNSDTNGLYNVYIGSDNGITTLSIGRNLFYNFTNVESIDFKYIDTSNVTDMYAMFNKCGKLKSLDLSNFDTSNVTTMNRMFVDCAVITSIDLSSFDTSKVNDMYLMFSHCYKLIELDLSHFDTHLVENMRSMFNQCYDLQKLDVSSFDTSKVINMRYMFNGCRNLTYLDVSSFDTHLVEDMSYMFSELYLLTKLDVSNFNTEKVKDMHRMFYCCRNLLSLDASRFDTHLVTDMYEMFNNCLNLQYLDISGFNTEKVTTMTRMFRNCYKLKVLDVSHFDTHLVTDMRGMFRSCESLTSLDLSSFDTSLVTDMADMFNIGDNIQTIVFGDDFTLNAIIEDKTSEASDDYKGIWRMFNADFNLDDNTLNSILKVLSTAGSGVQTKNLGEPNLHYTLRNKVPTLSNYQMFLDAGWTIEN